MTGEIGYVDITASRTGYDSMTKRFTVGKVRGGAQGDAAVTLSLSNNDHKIPTDSDGNNGAFDGAVTSGTVYNGGLDDSTNWTFSQTLVGVGGFASASLRSYTVESMAGDTGYVDIHAERTGYASITKRFSLSKNRGGIQGDSLYNVRLQKDSILIPTDSYGEGGDYSDLWNRASIYSGPVSDSTGWTFDWVLVGGTGNPLGNSAANFYITNMTSDIGSLTVTASRVGFDDIVKEVPVLKQRLAERGLQGLTASDVVT